MGGQATAGFPAHPRHIDLDRNGLVADEITDSADQVQRRWLELMRGARPLVENTHGKTEMEIVMEEIAQGKIAIAEACF
jgi:hypothetical protein